ncbi:MAG TPA: C25 family cysteine peptidase [Phnomibacter sp.]|nr:C25 family cysteine peptidase [Phnomibacter sp.]
MNSKKLIQKSLWLLATALLLIQPVQAQFNNEWINYNNTYYKFQIAAPGIYRINKSVLDAAGIGNTLAQHFQLWRNGKEVAMYTSVASGNLSANDYLEFFATKNDGTADKVLYLNPAHHINEKSSLFTDTASYFLTVNTASANARIVNTANNAAGSPLSPATNIWKNVRHDYLNNTIVPGVLKHYVNRGYAVDFGEYVYSSSYDQGELTSSHDIYPDQNGIDFTNRYANFSNLLPYTAGGQQAKIKVCIAGSATNNRTFRIVLNNAPLFDRNLASFDARVDSITTVSPALLNNAATELGVKNLSNNPNDRIVASFAEIDYPRLPDAGNTGLFDFYLPANAAPTLLEISNFNHGGVAPTLYDISSNTQMQGLIMPDGKIRFLLPASAQTCQYWLHANTPAASTQVTSLTTRSFINYSLANNQGNYIIITNNVLLGGNGNPVDLYRLYRSSPAGGGFNAKIYTVDELVDQFAFGIKMHPLSVKNFLRFARSRFATTPQYCFLIGKGVTYDEMRTWESHDQAAKMQLVPTFGYPASDILLASNDLTSTGAMPVGRLNVIRSSEVTTYLDKIKEFDAAQANGSTSQQDKAWMKNVVHVVGANDASIEQLIRPYMENYKNIVQDTLFGGKVTTFNKFNSTTGAVIENELLSNLFAEGISQLTYFGHSSASALDYNLDDPSQYNNKGKYPMFLLNGCNAGNFYTFDTSRLTALNTISEKYLLAPNRGAIGMIASTHFGIVNGLNVYSTGYYRSVSWQNYGQSIGKNMMDAIAYQNLQSGAASFIARTHTEQQTLHGDPALKVNAFPKPDYSVESQNITINPSFISIAESNFKTKVYYYNLGKAIKDSIVVEVTRQYPQSTIYPNGFTEKVYSRKVKAPMAIDSFELTLNIFPERDKGLNRISVMLDTENKVAEISELNNTVTRDIVIFEDELRPVYPYNYAIVNKSNIKLVASTSNPFSEPLNFRMEMDTTELFNSAAKITRNITSKGGMIEFDPGITLKDTIVYYWRLGIVRAAGDVLRWNNASFVYLAGTETGFNQSHFFQHTKSGVNKLYIDTASRKWKFATKLNNVFINHSIYPVTGTEDLDFSISVNNTISAASMCVGHSMVFNVFDPITFKPMNNYPGGLFGSAMNNCVPYPNFTRQNNFEYDDRDTGNRRKIMNFMDAIPNGSYVVVRKVLDAPYDQETFAVTLKSDEQYFGAGNSVYHRLKTAGFTEIDSFNRARIYVFVYKKNDNSFTPIYKLSEGIHDRLQLNINCPTPDSSGTISSPLFGPAKSWKQAKWRGQSAESTAGDYVSVDLVGVNASGTETLLRTLAMNEQDFDISSVNAATYPYMKLRMQNADSLNGTPYQLRWWRLHYTPVPEGALAPGVLLQMKDSLTLGESLDFKIAFKNISDAAFDSLKLEAFVLDRNNVTHPITLSKKKPLISGDTTTVFFSIDTKNLPGNNTLYVAVNPNNDQPEQYFFNNFLYKAFYVRDDKFDPLLDVTFDGVRILNRDIVSAKPNIQIKLKDENNFLALNDTAGLVIKLKFPSESAPRIYRWGTDTLRFTPASVTGGDNTATVDFTPALTEDTDGGEYELTVQGKDRNNNSAGDLEYRVTFKVFNKPMISNLLNYPNPFSTSTAFVFTITGQEIPQEFKIQILTVTGKIVKEIPKFELGPIHIGTNITEYKWDGTDTYGQKLANGVYLYRVVSSLNGNTMEKFKLNDGYDQQGQDVTDKFFNKGYGKMVILR